MKATQPAAALGLALIFVLLDLNPPALADDEADHAALRVIKAAYEEAVNSGVPSKIGPHLGGNATGVMVTGEAVEGLQGLEAYWKKIQDLIGAGGRYQVTVTVDQTDLLGDVAVSRGSTDDVVRLANGSELKFKSLWTSVCRRENGVWKVIRLQGTMNPVENVFVTAKLKVAKLTYGGGGLLTGVLLGFVLRAMRRQRP